MTEVMLDLETMGVRPGCVIVTIGAIKFSRTGLVQKLHEMPTFYKRINMDSCIRAGMHIEQETADWWSKQNEKAKNEVFTGEDRVPLEQALGAFSDWFKPCEKVWGNGDDFDCSILGEAYAICGLKTPWKYWNTRDLRTLVDLAGINTKDFPEPSIPHHAVHDSYRQYLIIREGLQGLRPL